MKSALDPEKHAPLIANMTKFCETAGIPPKYVEQSSVGYLTPDQQQWMLGYHDHAKDGCFGLVMTGMPNLQTMQAMTGAFLRNFVDARLMTLNVLLDVLRQESEFAPTVLIVPSFYRDGLTPFQVNLLVSLIEDRVLHQRQTILNVQSIAQLKHGYGEYMAQLIANHYTQLGG